MMGRSHSSVPGLGVGKVLRGSMIVNGTSSCMRDYKPFTWAFCIKEFARLDALFVPLLLYYQANLNYIFAIVVWFDDGVECRKLQNADISKTVEPYTSTHG